MIKKVNELPVILTCYAYRPEYVAELDGLLATVKEHHPDWHIVIGRGPVPGFDSSTLEVQSPSGEYHWTLPVPLTLDDSENDWRKIVLMKAWWTAQVWHNFGDLAGDRNRVLWIDADARLNGPLDIELEPEAEVVAGAWENYEGYEYMAGGLLIFQGVKHGPIEALVDQWSSKCLDRIENLPPPTVSWLDTDQEALTELLQSNPDSNRDYALLKLEYNKYCGITNKDGTRLPGALVDQWQMGRKMKWPECRDRDWPPPEEARRGKAVGAGLPLESPKDDPPDEAI